MDVTGPFASVLVALGMNILNALAGYAIAKWAFERDINEFLAIVFGSFAVRAMIVIALVWVLLSVVGMDMLWFSITFAIASFISLMTEILLFNGIKKKLIEIMDGFALTRTVRKMAYHITAGSQFRLLYEF